MGVIGTGRIGKIHIENLANRISEAEVTAIADVLENDAMKVATQFNIPHVYSDYKRVINHPEVEAVVICSPTNTHAQYIMESASAGKHIFCEKPVDITVEKIKSSIDAVEQAGVKLMVGFNRRFDSNFLKIKETVQSGKIGEPHILKITSRDPAPPPLDYVKVSGGLFLDMAIHDFDMARYLMQSEIKEVFAKGASLVDKKIGEVGDIDTAVTTLLFENGAIGVIDNSRQAVYGYDQRVEVFGSKGMIMVDNNRPDNHIYYNESGSRGSLPLNFFIDRYAQSYVDEMHAFVISLIENKDVLINGQDGLMAVVVALAANLSLKENRPVTLYETKVDK